MKKILVIQARPGIGDMCLFLPAIYKIGKNFDDHEVHLLTKRRSSSKDFLSKDKIIKKIIYLPDKNIWKLNKFIFRKIKKEKYCKCFIFHYGIRYFILSKISGVEKTFFYGLFKKKESIVYKSRSSVKKWLKKNELTFNCNLNIGIYNKKKNQITIGIGGSGQNKRWNIDNYIKLAIELYKKYKFEILIAGGISEKNDAQKIINKLSTYKVKVISICRKSIFDSLKPLSQSRFYIGNDTGFMHLSACLGVKSYGLFGNTPIDYTSYHDKLIPIKSLKKKLSNHNIKEIDQITVFDVLKKIIL